MIKKRFISMLVLLCLTVSGAWAQNPDWLLEGDEWDEATKTLTVNSNPGERAYMVSVEIENVIIANTVTTIGRGAFAGCFNLTSVSIPGNEVNGTTIANDAFNGCENLTTVTLGNGGGEINMYVFNGCKILTTVIVYAQSVDTWKVDDIFGNYNDELKIYVPSNLVDAFEEADGWSDYSGMFEAITNVTGVTLSPTSATLTLGETETVTLTATVLPDNATDKSVTWTTSDAAVATVANGVVTAVGAGTATITVTTTDGAFTATCAVTVAAPATYTVTVKEGTEDASNWQGKAGTGDYQELPLTGLEAGTAVSVKYSGAKKVKSVKAVKKAGLPVVNGKFSVSDTKQVYFSKGNLRYASGAWGFFDKQYDYYNSYSADAWDHFGWSTSATTYGMNTSTDNIYSGDFVDWGATMGTGWFTLSSDEWTYLFNTRSASTVNGTENGRYAKAKVNDVQGVILFPDTYTHPDGVTAPKGVNATNNTGWNGNSYTVEDWTKMESAGCVFLPAAGHREGSTVGNADASGNYWSATHHSTADYASYNVSFTSGTLNTAGVSRRKYGYSVRLVRQVTE